MPAGRPLAQRGIPFDRVGKAVELDEIHPLDAHAFQRKMNLSLGFVVGANACLGRQEKVPWILFEPRRDPEFRITVAGCDVNVIDTVAQQDLEGLIRFVLCDPG